MQRLSMAGLALATVLVGAAPASAAVLYEFTGEGGFSYTAPDFITADIFVPAGDLDSCTPVAGFTCQFASFSDSGGLDRVVFVQTDGIGTKSNSVFFPTDSFITPGTFFVRGATLTVSVVDTAVPEPAAWALMILGFGGVGGLMRRRRTALA